MFANTPARGPGGATSASGNLVEFKCGRANISPGSTAEKRKVVADKTKGLLFIKQTEDRLMHFSWKNRETGVITDDLIIFPGDTEFIRMKECPDGKVFMLKFKSSEERRIFWLQEPGPDADKGLVEKVNETLNNPPAARATRSGAGGADRGAAFSDDNSLDRLGQDQLMQLLQFVGGGAEGGAGAGLSTPAAGGAPSTPGAPARPILSTDTPNVSGLPAEFQEQIASVLRTVAAQGGTGRGAGGRGNGSRPTQPPIELSDVITGERVLESARTNADSLTPHLPSTEGSTPAQELEATVRAPQFRQAADTFGHAFQTGQLAPVLSQFGLPQDVVATGVTGDVLEFAKKLTEAEGGAKEEGEAPGGGSPTDTGRRAEEDRGQETPDALKGPNPKRGKTDDDNMDLD